jgi:hypothetical protein
MLEPPDKNNVWYFCSILYGRVLARIKSKHPKKHVATTMTCRLGEIFLVKSQKQAFSFFKREVQN